MHKKEHASKGSPFLDAVCVAAFTSLVHSTGHEAGCRKSQALLSGNFPMELMCTNEVLQ
jgi:hypothetical protein